MRCIFVSLEKKMFNLKITSGKKNMYIKLQGSFLLFAMFPLNCFIQSDLLPRLQNVAPLWR